VKLTFRATFLGILLTFIGVTLSLVGASSYYSARFTAQDLSAQLLEQTSARVEQQIQRLVGKAMDQSALNRRLLESGRLDLTNFPSLIHYWLDAMAVSPELSSVFIGLESSGESTGVSRLQGKLSIWQSNANPLTHRLDQRDFWPDGYPTKPYAFDPDKPAPDMRTRPWYVAARTAHKAIWTETYSFLGVAGAADVQGVTFATPVYRLDGALLAVLSADFDLKAIRAFLQTLHIGRTGFAFVVEQRSDGSRRVIADPGAPEGLMNALILHGTHFTYDGVSYIGSYRPLTGTDAPPWQIGIIVPNADVMSRVDRSNAISLAVAVGGFMLAILLGIYVARQVARPLEQLSNEMAAIRDLRLDARPIPHSIVLEVDRVAVATEEMKTGLRSFQKYVPADLVRLLLSSKREAQLGGERRRVTTYFSDIADFTAISERLSPEAVVEQLREYFGALNARILSRGGTLDKFIGDAVMAFWGAPVDNPRQALDACLAALEIAEVLAALGPEWERQGKPRLTTRIGINTGEALVGNVGSEARFNYTVIGDAINLASRLEGLNKIYGTTILLGEDTYAAVADAVVARPIDWVAVKGRTSGAAIYELLGRAGDVELVALAAAYRLALDHYRAQHWAQAITAFEADLVLRPSDGPSHLMLRRCRTYGADPPKDWDGIHRHDSK